MDLSHSGFAMTVPEQQRNGLAFKRAAPVVMLFAVALALRFWGIEKESFWFDEAYSVLGSNNSVAEILAENANDVHPPLFYIGLYFWRGMLGDSDGHIRAYSAAWSLIGLLAVFLLAVDIGGRRVGVIVLLLAAVNPLDVYYAQEARMYSQAAALCVFSSWCLWRWMARIAESRERASWWRWAAAYAMFAAAALYTHYLSALVLVTQGVFALLWFARRKRWASVAAYAASALVVTVAFLPWVVYVYTFRETFYHTGLKWIKVHAASDFFSFLGREMFWGGVFTIHSRWWIPTMVLPLALFAIHLWRVWRSGRSASRAPEALGLLRTLYPFCLLIGPLFLALLVTAFYYPIYVRMKLSIFLLSPFLILVALVCDRFRHRSATWLTTAAFGGIMLAGTCAQYFSTQKSDWRQFAKRWRDEGPPGRIVFFPHTLRTPASHYLDRWVESAPRKEIQWTLPNLVGRDLWICREVVYKMNPDDDDYYKRLLRLGPVRRIFLYPFVLLRIVRVEGHFVYPLYDKPFDRVYAPIDIYGTIEDFSEKTGFYALEFDGATSAPFRLSTPKAWFCLLDNDTVGTVVLGVQLPLPITPDYRPDLRVYMERGEESSQLFAAPPVVRIDDNRAGEVQVALRVPEGTGPLWIGWTVRGVNLARAGISRDERDLGIRLDWVGVVDRSDPDGKQGRDGEQVQVKARGSDSLQP